MGAMDYIILKPAGSHSLGDPRNLEDVLYLLVTRTNVVSLPLGLLFDELHLITIHTRSRATSWFCI